MTVTSVLDLTKKALAQAMGATYMSESGTISALEAGKLVDVGRDVDEANALESFTKALVDVIGKYDIDVKEYKGELVSLYVDSFDWGGFLERVKFDFNTVIDDPMYNLIDGKSYADIEHKFYQPKVKAKLFVEGKAIVVPISIQEESVRTAFKDMSEMAIFISGIREQIITQIKYTLDVYAHLLVSSGICVSVKSTKNAVHLITEAKANGILTEDDTVSTALNNQAFLKYVLKRITNLRSYFKRPSTAFNNGSIPTWSSDSNLALLSDFVSDSKFGVLADTYHADEVGIGTFDKVTSWQGTYDGTDRFDFDTLSKIIIDDTDNKLGTSTSGTVTIENVIGLMYDKKALGICPHRSKITSSYTASTDHWNEFHHEFFNYLLDSDLNMVALVLD